MQKRKSQGRAHGGSPEPPCRAKRRQQHPHMGGAWETSINGGSSPPPPPVTYVIDRISVPSWTSERLNCLDSPILTNRNCSGPEGRASGFDSLHVCGVCSRSRWLGRALVSGSRSRLIHLYSQPEPSPVRPVTRMSRRRGDTALSVRLLHPPLARKAVSGLPSLGGRSGAEAHRDPGGTSGACGPRAKSRGTDSGSKGQLPWSANFLTRGGLCKGLMNVELPSGLGHWVT